MTHVWGAWEKIPTLDNCRAAVRAEAQTGRCKRNGFALDLILREEYWARYVLERVGSGLKLGSFTEFDTWEHGKLRHVRCYEPEDAMCVRAVVRVLEPLVYRRMSPHSYCPVHGRGGLALAMELCRRSRKAENICRVWNKAHPNARHKWQARVNEFDLQNYYASLRYEVMHDTWWRHFGEPEIRNLGEVFLSGRDGLPIGAGYSSMIANMTLAPLDWMIERHKGVLGYGRNMDNGTYLTKSKSVDHDVRHIVEDWCSERGLVTHEWSHYPVGHHAIERGGWRIEKDRILPGSKVMMHIERLMAKKWSELDIHEMCALASLYGYVVNSDCEKLKRRWKEGNYSKIFKVISVTSKEAEHGIIYPPKERKAA